MVLPSTDPNLGLISAITGVCKLSYTTGLRTADVNGTPAILIYGLHIIDGFVSATASTPISLNSDTLQEPATNP